MSSPINTRYHRERTIRTGKTKLAGWSTRDVAQLLKRQGKGMPKAPPVTCPRCGFELTGGTSGDRLVHDHRKR